MFRKLVPVLLASLVSLPVASGMVLAPDAEPVHARGSVVGFAGNSMEVASRRGETAAASPTSPAVGPCSLAGGRC